MRKNFIYILLFSAAMFMGLACQRESEPLDEGRTGSLENGLLLNFTTDSFGDVTVSTKATLGIDAESRIYNMLVFLFNNSGDRIYMGYFDASNKVGMDELVRASEDNLWWVSNTTDTSDPLGDYGSEAKRTHGLMHLRTPRIEAGAEGYLYAIANIDADMVNISPEKLSAIHTRADLLTLTARLNQLEVRRNGYFPMVASTDLVTIDGLNIRQGSGGGTKEWKLRFSRLDAKIKVSFRVATDNELVNAAGDTSQTLKTFIPESWEVYNIPWGCRVFDDKPDTPAGTTDEPNADAEGYFNWLPVPFEETEYKDFTYTDARGDTQTVIDSPHYSFSFYMMENRESGHKNGSAANVHMRELRKKNTDGSYEVTEGDMWANAPQWGTYIVVKGRVLMDVDVSSQAKSQELNADVTYCIHLGDIKSSADNYDIRRNTFYSYTVTIKGVHSIAVEVDTSNPEGRVAMRDDITEDEPGASGLVNIARESVYTFDAHYGQRVFCFDAENIDMNNVSWFVKSPMNADGSTGYPSIAEDGKTFITSGLDFRWVQFSLNEAATASPDGYDKAPYRHNNKPYPGDAYKNTVPTLMYITDFCNYMKEQKALFDAGEANDFRPEFDQVWYDKYIAAGATDEVAREKAKRWRIYFTVYVDEYYYDTHPISGQSPADLWKQFVNQPNRFMLILCDYHKSLDGDSDATGSVITIRQSSIQTPYNIEKEGLVKAWGAETVDETFEKTWFFSTEETIDQAGYDLVKRLKEEANLPNTTNDNGLLNTAVFWGITDKNGVVVTPSNPLKRRWDYYLDFTQENDANYVFMNDRADDPTVATMRYTCMMRNRDNDGDGEIDLEEIKWYIASTKQITGLFYGGQALSRDAQIYPESIFNPDHSVIDAGSIFSGVDNWRNHIVTSTVVLDKRPQIVWAEEGLSLGEYKEDFKAGASSAYGKSGRYSVRCVRNLGTPLASAANINTSAVIPEDMTQVSGNPSAGYTFDNTRINYKSQRYYTYRPLEIVDEHAEMSRLPQGFETGPVSEKYNSFKNLKDMQSRGESPCPDGWRVPNIREAAIMNMYCLEEAFWKTDGKWLDVGVCTSYSNASRDTKNNGTWVVRYYNQANPITIGTEPTITRCVRDWVPGTPKTEY